VKSGRQIRSFAARRCAAWRSAVERFGDRKLRCH
jgi:hypothetical protein